MSFVAAEWLRGLADCVPAAFCSIALLARMALAALSSLPRIEEKCF